jgi:hypothetical protein
VDEAERLAYLDAMGVESYTPRMILPGALPSALYDIDSGKKAEVPEPAPEIISGSTSGKDVLKHLQLDVPDSTTVIAKAPVPQKQVQTQVSVRFHWAIFQPTPAILLLLPSAHTEQNCMELLKKMMSAIGVIAPLLPLEDFVWPPVLHNPSRRATSSLADARETLHALLEGYQLKQKKLQQPLKHVLVFEENLGKTLFDGAVFPDLQLRILPSLQLMLTSSPEKVAELKRSAWQRLKDLKA